LWQGSPFRSGVVPYLEGKKKARPNEIHEEEEMRDFQRQGFLPGGKKAGSAVLPIGRYVRSVFRAKRAASRERECRSDFPE